MKATVFVAGSMLICLVNMSFGFDCTNIAQKDFLEKVDEWRVKNIAFKSRKIFRKYLSDNGDNFLHAVIYSNQLGYFDVPVAELNLESKGYDLSKDISNFIDISDANEPVFSLVNDHGKFIGVVDCESKLLGYLAYCSCDNSLDNISGFEMSWNIIKAKNPDFVFAIKGFRGCLFYFKQGKTFVIDINNKNLYDSSVFIENFGLKERISSYNKKNIKFIY